MIWSGHRTWRRTAGLGYPTIHLTGVMGGRHLCGSVVYAGRVPVAAWMAAKEIADLWVFRADRE